MLDGNSFYFSNSYSVEKFVLLWLFEEPVPLYFHFQANRNALLVDLEVGKA